jgi:hypothetical protein
MDINEGLVIQAPFCLLHMGVEASLKTYDRVQCVMLNSFQHLITSMGYETLKLIQGDK